MLAMIKSFIKDLNEKSLRYTERSLNFHKKAVRSKSREMIIK